jgi:hypothetical protein
VINKCPMTSPLTVSHANGQQVASTPMCDVHINGLPVVLTGHIIPELSIASLFAIVVLTKARCKVRFDKLKCTVRYNNKIILESGNDKATNLWMLPIGTQQSMTSHRNPVLIPSTAPGNVNAHAHHATTEIVFFMHTAQNKANSIQFAHQSLCSPRISTLLKAIRCGYLKGCPNLSAAGISKYFNLSSVTTKSHMKWPCMGIQSTRRTHIHAAAIPQEQDDPNDAAIVSVNQSGIISLDNSSVASTPPRPSNTNIIISDDELSEANIFCFAAFANKQTGTLYNDLTGAIQFMSLEGNIFF